MYQMLAQKSLLLYTKVGHNTAQNSSNNVSFYRPDDHHSSDAVCLGEEINTYVKLRQDIISTILLPVFRRRPKTHLFDNIYNTANYVK